MEIADFFDLYQGAAWNKDATAMINLYHEHVEIFDMWDHGYIADTAEWKNIIIDWLGSLGEEKVKVAFDRVTIHQSDTVGFASALIQFQAIATDGHVLRSMKNRITLGFIKTDEGWKANHQHTSAPISSDGLTAVLAI
jgi:ketosteroid isomerase-like protein